MGSLVSEAVYYSLTIYFLFSKKFFDIYNLLGGVSSSILFVLISLYLFYYFIVIFVILIGNGNKQMLTLSTGSPIHFLI